MGQVVIGRPRALPWWRRLTGARSVAEALIRTSRGVTVVVVDADSGPTAKAPARPAAAGTKSPAASRAGSNGAAGPAGAAEPAGPIERALRPSGIVIWDNPVSRQQIFRGLAEAICKDAPNLDPSSIVSRLEDRERQGSTFLNEGVALPHARIEGLDTPRVALGITQAGVVDGPTETPIEAVFLLLSPAGAASSHLQLLSKAARLLQSRDVRQHLSQASSSDDVLGVLHAEESAAASKPGGRNW